MSLICLPVRAHWGFEALSRCAFACCCGRPIPGLHHKRVPQGARAGHWRDPLGEGVNLFPQPCPIKSGSPYSLVFLDPHALDTEGNAIFSLAYRPCSYGCDRCGTFCEVRSGELPRRASMAKQQLIILRPRSGIMPYYLYRFIS